MGYWLCFVFRLGIKNHVILLVLAKTANVQVLWHAYNAVLWPTVGKKNSDSRGPPTEPGSQWGQHICYSQLRGEKKMWLQVSLLGVYLWRSVWDWWRCNKMSHHITEKHKYDAFYWQNYDILSALGWFYYVML